LTADYNPAANEIVLPAGIMQPPLFDVAQPQYLNYGGLGDLAARELARALGPPPADRLVDETGKRPDPWTPAAGGCSAAADAANEVWVRGRSMRDHDLPGLERRLTHEQLFFVGGAAARCGGGRRRRADPHAPVHERALGGVAHATAFREAFKCPAKELACEVW
jgi:endothelin-converting enzyme